MGHQLASEDGARALLEKVGVDQCLLEQLSPDEDLLSAGVGSAQMIELTILLEDHIERGLTAEEAEQLTTLEEIDALLFASTAATGREAHI